MAEHEAALPRTPRPYMALAESARMLRARPFVSLAMGAAVGLSLLSICCGLGLVTAPWSLCELSVLQLGLCTQRPIERGPSVLGACWLWFWGVLLLSSVLAISWLGAGSAGTAFSLDSVDDVLRSGAVAALISCAAAWLLITPVMYAPLIVLERRTSATFGLADSTRLVLSTGIASGARLGLAILVVQHAPWVLAAWLTGMDPEHAALFWLCAAPLMCVSVPLGQGMLAWAYVQVGGRGQAAVDAIGEPRALPGAARRWIRVLGLLIVMPVVALVLLELSLSRPSRIVAGRAPAGDVLLDFAPTPRTETAELPATPLTLTISAERVSVAASDGGGVGMLPLSAAGPITHVRVVRVRDTFAIELVQGGRYCVTTIDRAGVRLDDGLRARLRDHSRPWQWLFFLLTLLLTCLLSVPVLYDFGSLARLDHGAVLDRAIERASRRARVLSLWLAPVSLGCLAVALWVLFAA